MKEKLKSKKNFIYLGVAVLIIASWVIGTGLTIVKPQTVQIVRVPERVGPFTVFEKPEAYMNDTNGTLIFLSWPRIPFTNIGSKEETYSLKEPLKINLKTELFTLADMTGDPNDKNKVIYMTASGTAQVTDWSQFLSDWKGSFWDMEFYPELAKEKNISRVYLVEKMLEEDLKYYFIDSVNVWFSDYISRIVYVDRIMRENNLQTAEEIENFIKTKEPWYWSFGPFLVMSSYEELQKNPSPDQSLGLLGKIFIEAENCEKALNEIDSKLSEIESQKEYLVGLFSEELVSSTQDVIYQFKKYLKLEGKKFAYSDIEEFREYLGDKNCSSQELFVNCALYELERERELQLYKKEFVQEYQDYLRNEFKSLYPYSYDNYEGNVSLWKLAIEKVVDGKSLDAVDVDAQSYLRWFIEDGGKYFKDSKINMLSLMFEGRYGIKLNLSFQIVEETIKDTKDNRAPVK